MKDIKHQAPGIKVASRRRFFASAWYRGRHRNTATPLPTAGFTLIEMIVAVAIFMFVMLVAVGSLVALVGADRKAQSIEAVVDNLRFALDDMSRYVRTGTKYDGSVGCLSSVESSKDCYDGTNQISIKPQVRFGTGGVVSSRMIYQFAGASTCGTGFTGGCLRRSSDGGTSFFPITSPEINIDVNKSHFYVRGSTAGDGQQPMITMALMATIDANVGTTTTFYLQSTVTQRFYDK